MMMFVRRPLNINGALRLLTLSAIGGAILVGACATRAAGGIIVGTGLDNSRVNAFDGSSAVTASFLAYPGFNGGVRVATGDVSGDGISDLITGAGFGGGGHVKVFDGDNGAEIRSFFAYGPSFTGGIFVGAGDANDDGIDDVVTGVQSGAAPHVKVFSGATGTELRSFFAFDAGFTGGVRVASGDIDGDGFDDVITGAGIAGGGHVKVFSGATGGELRSFLAYGSSFSGGIFVGGGDVNNDGIDDIITGADSGSTSHVKVFSGVDGTELRSFLAFSSSFTGGVRVAGGDIDGDGFADIITGQGPGASEQGLVKVFSGQTGAELRSFFAYGSRYSGGVFVAAGAFVPEPSGAMLFLCGVLGLAARRRRLIV